MNDIADIRTELPPKNPIIYSCTICNFDTRNKKDFNRHLTTAKHKKLDVLNGVEPDSPHPISCSICQKEYVSRSGMWYHQKKCKGPAPESTDIPQPTLPKPESTETPQTTLPKPESTETPQTTFPKPESTETPQTTFPKPEEMMALMLELVKQNSEFKDLLIEQNKQMMELANKAGNNNNCNNTTNNNKFNLNVFLNETCKDAITMDDFINSIQVTREDFIHTGEFGFIEGISTTLMKNFRNMDLHTRPLHCTDLKRETVYIKNADKWEKDDADKTHLRKAVRGVAKKNMKEMWRWYNDSKPEVEQIGTDVCEKYFAYHKASLGGYGKEEDLKFEDKIMKNVLKDNQIDKNIICV
jgi:hypothetical protein